MLQRHVQFDGTSPTLPDDAVRLDVACFLGFLAVRKGVIADAQLAQWFDRQGQSIKKVVLNTPRGLKKWHQLSQDGSRFLYTQSRGKYWHIVDTEAPLDIIYKRDDGAYDASTFSRTGKYLFFRSWGGIARLNVDTGDTVKIYDAVKGLGGTAYYTLINTD